MGGGLRKIFWFVVAAVTLSFTIGCGDDYCGDSASGIPLVGIYSMGNPPKAAAIDSLTVYGKDQVNDSILYDTARNVSTFYTPLNITENTVKYVLRYDKKGIAEQYKFDTLTYVYSKELKFETPECGAAYTFTIKEFRYTQHSIVYAELVTPVVNSISSTTVNIYYASGN